MRVCACMRVCVRVRVHVCACVCVCACTFLSHNHGGNTPGLEFQHTKIHNLSNQARVQYP